MDPVTLGLGASAALLFLLTPRGTAKASRSALPNVQPKPGPAPSPHKVPIPPGGMTARVLSSPGMNTRSAPSPSAGLVAHNDAFNGTTVQVLETGIPESGAPADAPMRWWKIVTPGGSTGYARAIGPQGEANFDPNYEDQGGGTSKVEPNVDPVPNPGPAPTEDVSAAIVAWAAAQGLEIPEGVDLREWAQMNGFPFPDAVAGLLPPGYRGYAAPHWHASYAPRRAR